MRIGGSKLKEKMRGNFYLKPAPEDQPEGVVLGIQRERRSTTDNGPDWSSELPTHRHGKVPERPDRAGSQGACGGEPNEDAEAGCVS